MEWTDLEKEFDRLDDKLVSAETKVARLYAALRWVTSEMSKEGIGDDWYDLAVKKFDIEE